MLLFKKFAVRMNLIKILNERMLVFLMGFHLPAFSLAAPPLIFILQTCALPGRPKYSIHEVSSPQRRIVCP